ncbi:MAG: cell division protein FtsA [Bacteroides sp.]|nr:cell division protein FtsA [Bacteroides sp.]
MSDRYIVAVEISSSKIIASIGTSTVEGRLDVIAIEQESCVDAVRHGIIQNLEETSVKLQRLLLRLEQTAQISPKKIKGVVVGLSGRSLRSLPTEVVRHLAEDTEIDTEIIESLKASAMRTVVEGPLEVVDAVPRIYKVGKTETYSPKGMIGNRIEATFDLVVCRQELRRNINRTLPDKLGIRIEGFVVTALASAYLILTPDEKRLGCMLVDMGAETTTVTIYKDGCLRYFATLPMGGRNITRDITSLHVLEERAEEIKLQSGKAIVSESSNLNLSGIKISDVNKLVVARSEEIVANIVEQMEYAGLHESKLPGGIVCIGGASRLSEMMELLRRQSNLPVRRGELPRYVAINDAKAAKLEYIQVVSVMYAGTTLSDKECVEDPVVEEAPKPTTQTVPPHEHEREPEREPEKENKRRGGLFRSFTRRMSELFRNPADDDSDLIDE